MPENTFHRKRRCGRRLNRLSSEAVARNAFHNYGSPDLRRSSKHSMNNSAAPYNYKGQVQRNLKVNDVEVAIGRLSLMLTSFNRGEHKVEGGHVFTHMNFKDLSQFTRNGSNLGEINNQNDSASRFNRRTGIQSIHRIWRNLQEAQQDEVEVPPLHQAVVVLFRKIRSKWDPLYDDPGQTFKIKRSMGDFCQRKEAVSMGDFCQRKEVVLVPYANNSIIKINGGCLYVLERMGLTNAHAHGKLSIFSLKEEHMLTLLKIKEAQQINFWSKEAPSLNWKNCYDLEISNYFQWLIPWRTTGPTCAGKLNFHIKSID